MRVVLIASTSIAIGASTGAIAENKLESWYTYWGLGYASFSYPSEVNTAVNEAKNAGLENISVSLDLLGFYWPNGEKTLMGFMLNAAGDRFEEGGVHLQINSYLVSASAMYFPTGRIGKGPFVRLDVGPTRINLDTSFGGDFNSAWGIGALLGGGVGFPITPGTRLLLNANYTIRRVEGDDVKILGVSVGGLF